MKFNLLMLALTMLFTGQSSASNVIAQNKANIPYEQPAASYRARLIANAKAFGNAGNTDYRHVIQAVVYIHPLYLDQSLVASPAATNGDLTANGSTFTISRIGMFIDDINLTLLNSGINAIIETKFITVLPDDFPIIGSTGYTQLTAPDGMSVTTTDAGYFDWLVQDWEGAASKYGFTASHVVRQIRDASSADLHIFIRPFIDENVIPSSDLTESLSSYLLSRPLIDSEPGFGFNFTSMAIYDQYWFLGAQKFNPLSGYGLRTAAHQFGHVLGAGHEQGKSDSVYPYGNAYTCGGITTVMHSIISPLTYPIYSSPNNFINGEPCGIAVGLPNQASNTDVLNLNIPLLAAVAEPESTDNEVYLLSPPLELQDGEVVSIDVFRTGNLQNKTFATLYAIPGSARENEDYLFRLQTVVFQEGEDYKQVKLTIPQRTKNPSSKSFSIVAGTVLNGYSPSGMNQVDITISPNEADPLSFSIGELPSTVTEGMTLNVVVTPNSPVESNRTIILSVESPNMVEEVNYRLSATTMLFERGSAVGQQVQLILMDDGTYRAGQYMDLRVTEADNMLDSKRLQVTDSSQPDAGTISFQNETIQIDNLQGELSFRLHRNNGLDGNHVIQVRLSDNNPVDYSKQVILPEPIGFTDGETEKTSVLKFTTHTPTEYVFDAYSETTQSVTDTFRVKVVKATSLPIVNVSSNVKANENSEFAPIIINRSDSREDLTITVEYIEESAKAGVDFTGDTTSIKMPAGIDSVTLQIPVMNILSESDDRTFKVRFSSDLAQFGVDTASVTVVDVKATQDDDDGKIDKYEAGSLSFWWLLVILPLLFIRKSKEYL